MAVDIQVLSSVLLREMQTQLQQSFNTTCFPPFDAYYVDHVDVTSGTTSVTSTGAVEFTLPVDVWIVNQTALLASANGTPSTTIGTASIILTLTISGTTLQLACTQVTFGIVLLTLFGPAAGFVEVGIKSSIPTVSTDLNSIFSGLGISPPSTSAITLFEGSLFISFDASGAPVNNLQSGQEWCIFIDATTMQNLSAAKVNHTLGGISLITSHTTTAEWAPSGTVPIVKVTVTGKVTIPDPFSGSFRMYLEIQFGIEAIPALVDHVPVLDLVLTELVSWAWVPETGQESVNAKEAAEVLTQFNSTGFGGTVISSFPYAGLNVGGQFLLQSTLPTLSLGNAAFGYSSPVGLATGMVLGGLVTGIVTPAKSLVKFDVNQFSGNFTLLDYCMTGPQFPSLANVTATASASYSGASKLCAVTQISPSPSTFDLSPYLGVSPGPGTITDTGWIVLQFNGVISQILAKTGEPIEFLVQTAGGVRVINLGMAPTPQIGILGVTNVSYVYVHDCPIPPTAVDPWYQVFQSFNPLWNVDPPDSWVDSLEQVAAFEASIITIAGLQPGEIVTFNQPIEGGLTVVSADLNGLAVLPTVLAVRTVDERAVLSRANRAVLGTPAVTYALFERVATLNTPGAVSHQISGGFEDAVITTIFQDGSIQNVLVCQLGVSRPFPNQPAPDASTVSANGRTPASALRAPGSGWSVEIPGLVKVLTVPGHEDAGIAVAKLSDGTYRVLSRQTDGSVRVAGLVPRWPDMPPVFGRWAISSGSGDRVAVFKLRRAAFPKCSCDCHKDTDSTGNDRLDREFVIRRGRLNRRWQVPPA
jgi:hypothetical protein